MWLALSEEELLVFVFPLGDAKADKTSQEGDDLRAEDVRTTDNQVEWLFLVLQDIKNLSDGIRIGHHGTLRILQFAPDG